jgi:hypothetical protein
MRNRLMPLGALVGGLLLTFAVAITALGYAGQVAATVTVSAPSGSQPCGTPITVTAVFQATGGALISAEPVTWSFGSGNVSGDTILITNSTTNTNGVATTSVQFACSPHGVVLDATGGGMTGTVAITVTGQALPRTDIAPSTSIFAIVLAALAVLIGSGMMLRRISLGRR